MAKDHGGNLPAAPISTSPIVAAGSKEQKGSLAPQIEHKIPIATHRAHHNKSGDFKAEKATPWSNQELTPLELVDWISTGHAWLACHLSDGQRNQDSADISDLLVLDIDGDISLDDFWAISPVARHCLFTATSCSHSPDEHRFRAVFRCERHDDHRLHKALYHQLLALLGLKLKDNSGEKPERLWYGNSNAEVRFGGGEPLGWELTENAKDALTAAAKAKPVAPSSSNDQALDCRRAAWVLEHLLRPSADGEFQAYWSPLLNAAAATGDDAVRDAFMVWHHKGHHSKSQKQVAKRLDKAGTRKTPGEGAGRILQFAKQQHGEQWWRLLPESLWYGGGPAITPPISLLRARSAADIAAADDIPITEPPESPETGGSSSLFRQGRATVPDKVPSALELQRLATVAAASTTLAEPLTLEAKLRRLYMLRAHGVLLLGDDIQEVPEDQRPCLDRDLLGDVLAHPGYCNQTSEVERDLLTLFRHEQGLRDNSHGEVQGIKLVGRQPKRPQWLIPGFLIAGGEHILYAKAGVGKTTLALHMVRAVTGDPSLDRFLDSGPLNNHHIWQRNPVLFIGTDMFGSAEEMTTKYLEDFDLYGRDFLEQVEWWFEQEDSPAWLLTLKDLTKFYRYLESHHHAGTPVAAVFIDSMKAVCPDHLLVGQQGFKDYIKLIKIICKRFGAALIWVHHSRADGSGAQGITRITEGSDANLHLKRDDKTKQLTLEIEKLRGGRSRTLYINPFKPEPQLLPNPEEIADEDSIENRKEQMVLEVMAEHFKQHRMLNMTSSAEFIESSYEGMKIGDIEEALRDRFRGSAAGISRRTLERLIGSLKSSGRIEPAKKARYRLPTHFQPALPDQPELTDSEDDIDLPGW